MSSWRPTSTRYWSNKHRLQVRVLFICLSYASFLSWDSKCWKMAQQNRQPETMQHLAFNIIPCGAREVIVGCCQTFKRLQCTARDSRRIKWHQRDVELHQTHSSPNIQSFPESPCNALEDGGRWWKSRSEAMRSRDFLNPRWLREPSHLAGRSTGDLCEFNCATWVNPIYTIFTQHIHNIFNISQSCLASLQTSVGTCCLAINWNIADADKGSLKYSIYSVSNYSKNNLSFSPPLRLVKAEPHRWNMVKPNQNRQFLCKKTM